MIQINLSDTFRKEKEYVLWLVFEYFLGVEYMVEFIPEFNGRTTIKSDQSKRILTFPDSLFSTQKSKWLKNESLPKLPLRIRNLEDFENHKFIEKSIPVLFGDNCAKNIKNDKNHINFDVDILGGIFFLVTLYEESLPSETDQFGRYDYKQSTLFKSKLLKRPIANEYIEILWFLLGLIDEGLIRKKRQYKLILSHDIDHPLANNHSTLSFVKSCLADIIHRKSFRLFFKRFYSKISRNKNLDPNNTFDFLMNSSDAIGVKSEFNFISINGNRGIDGAYDITDSFFKKILKKINQRGHIIGTHPGYYSLDDFNETSTQFNTLRMLCDNYNINQKRWGGRQHYLRWKNPSSWAIWEEMGADYDSSIGSEFFMGFRSGICYEYPVYDLKRRRKLALLEYPLIVMDVCAFKLGGFENYAPEVIKLSKICKQFNGNFTLLFHNNYVIAPSQKRNYNKLLNEVK